MGSRNTEGRILKWKISYDKRVAALPSPWAKLAFDRIISSMDNLGRMEGDPEVVGGMIFPLSGDADGRAMMEEILQQLHDAGLVFWYDVNGERFIQVPGAQKNQKIVGNMTDKSDFPEPPAETYWDWLVNVRKESRLDLYEHVCTRSNTFPEGKGSEGKRREEKGIIRARARDEQPKLTTTTPPPGDDEVSWLTFYEAQFAGPPPHKYLSAIGRKRSSGITDAVIIEALRRGRVAGATNVAAWADAALGNWFAAGVRTLEDLRRMDEAAAARASPGLPAADVYPDLTVKNAQILQQKAEVVAGAGRGKGPAP